MALVGQLAVALTARTQRFNRGMAGASGQVQRFSGSVSLAKVALLPFVKMLAMVGGPLILGRMAMRTAKSTDELAKMARALSVSTEFLVGAHHAANLAGVGLESLNNSLHRLNRSIGEAVRRGGEARERFTDIGFDPARLAAMGTEEAFLEVLDALGAMPDAGKRADAANRLFGRSYRDLMKIVGSGAEDIRAGIREAKILGNTFDSESAGKVEDMNDSFVRLWATIRGGTRRMVAWIAPAVTGVVQGLIRIRVAAGVVWDFVAETFGPALVRQVSAWGSSIAQVLMNAGKAWFEAIISWEAGGGLRVIFAHLRNGAIALRIAVAQVANGVRALTGEFLGFISKTQRAWLEMFGERRARAVSRELAREVDAMRGAEAEKQRLLEEGRDAEARIVQNAIDTRREHIRGIESEYNRLLDELGDIQRGETGLEAFSRRALEAVREEADITADILKETPFVDIEAAKKQGGYFGDGFLGGLIEKLQHADKALLDVLGRKLPKPPLFDDINDGLNDIHDGIKRAATPAAMKRGTAAAFGIGAQAQAQARLGSIMQREGRERLRAEERAAEQRERLEDELVLARKALEGSAEAGESL